MLLPFTIIEALWFMPTQVSWASFGYIVAVALFPGFGAYLAYSLRANSQCNATAATIRLTSAPTRIRRRQEQCRKPERALRTASACGPSARCASRWRALRSRDRGFGQGGAARVKLPPERAMTMNRKQILALLAERRQELAARFAVKRLGLFGSAARDELRDGSDIDLLVEFEGAATFDGYFGLKDHLEALLGRTVDLVTERGLKPRARRSVEKDLVGVA